MKDVIVKRSEQAYRWGRQSILVWDYIVREAAGPFIMALTVIMFVFLLQFLMRFIDRIVGRGLSVWTIVELIVFNLSWMVVLAIPMAVLVACVMAFGSMASANELTAMKAAGVSLGRMIFPAIVLCTLVAIFDLQFNNIILPNANHRAKDLMMDINQKKPSLIIEPGTFTTNDEIPGYSILARTADAKTNNLGEITIYDHSNPSLSRVITAASGHVAFTPDFRNIILTLYNGELHEVSSPQPMDYRRGTFGEYIVRVPATGYDFMHEGESERSGRELSASDLLIRVHADEKSKAREVKSLRGHLAGFAHALTSDTLRAEIPLSPHIVIPPETGSTSSVELGGRTIPAPPVPSHTPTTRGRMRSTFAPWRMSVQSDAASISETQGDLNNYLVETHKKYAIPASCIIFALIGVPLGALAKRSGVGAGTGLSIGFFVLYWVFLIGGEKLADRGVITPFWGMWGGDLILLAIGIGLTWRAASERQVHFGRTIKQLWSIRFQPKIAANEIQ